MKTKLLITFLILSSFSFFYCNGQDIGFVPSIIVGTNFATLNSDQIENSSKPGFVAGFNLIARTGDKLDILTEFTYVHKPINTTGRECDPQTYKVTNTTSDYVININTATWSVIANYYIKAPNFSLQAGPYLGINKFSSIPSKIPELYYGDSEDPNEDISLENLLNGIHGLEMGLDYGLLFGISGGTEAVRINLRYHLGLKDYYKDFDTQGYFVKSNYIELSIAYTFLNQRIER